MKNSPAQILLDICITVLFALYVFFFYQLLIIPAVLDWSVYGIALSVLLVFLLAWSLPATVRTKWLVLAAVFLLGVKSLNNLQDNSLSWQITGGAIIFLILLVTGYIAGRFHLRQFVTAFLIAVMLTYTVDLTQIPFWSEFSVKWKSPLLYPKQTSVDYFPVQVADIDRDGLAEIITQGNPRKARDYITHHTRPPKEPLEGEENQVLVYKWSNEGFQLMAPGSYDPEPVLSALKPDYISLPYYKMKWEKKAGGQLQQKLTPQLNVTGLMDLALNFGMAPFSSLQLSLESVASRDSSIKQLYKNMDMHVQPTATMLDYKSRMPVDRQEAKNLFIDGYNFSGEFAGQEFRGTTKGTGIMAGGTMAGNKKVAILLGKSLEVLALTGPQAGSLLGELTGEDVEDVSTAEILTADVNNDNIDEIMLNTEYAKLLQLKPDGQWKVIWSSRDDSFRFEDFNTLGSGKKPEIIALSKSLVRNNPTRYITGYELTPGGLKTRWRVFTGLINLQAADVDGDKENELIGYLYKNHRLFVLEKHNIPVTQILYGITGLLIACGIYLRLFKKPGPGEVR
ncbi:hypothetical protein Tfer_3190 [Thermincola ferriacetica]|uniref:Uncharacterized protein n=1 Tax=Thermincola ferriacetica TaxID=281456 RepID=A0A0L6VZJ3_9FIRM|nr:hypothetical protein [Thermincola ferriacetica]KNZ68264.1 hypothetical protein Tfer_3190 [Thermincola ferriacetica]